MALRRCGPELTLAAAATAAHRRIANVQSGAFFGSSNEEHPAMIFSVREFRPTAALVSATMLATLLCACGGSNVDPGPEGAAAARINQFWAALTDGEGQSACKMGTPSFREGMARLNDQQLHSETVGSTGCEAAIAFLAGQTDSPATIEATSADVTITGQIATAEENELCFVLVEQDGEWLIAALPNPMIPGKPCAPPKRDAA
jgi:hypothetical protein